ncbi:alpha-2-macroglobulin family protein [Lysobacter sp. Root983]|uniref:alpha-2-macroglobulin family protein n=1 Tax=Lysobacter sp. Root983 TaxID=1736613 RepID=UPI000A6E874C|nr:alpha-2-macroglobulin family protein [Lysobacter sp. Root983]
MRACDELKGWLTAALCAMALTAPAQAATAQGVQVEADMNLDSLTIAFDRPMRVWDNSIAADQIRIEPALPLQCAWSDDLRILCRYGEGRHPATATEYAIRLGAGLRTGDGAAVPAQTLKLEYLRPDLSAEVRDWKNGVPTIELSTSAKSTMAQVADVLTLTVDGRDMPLPALKSLPPSWAWQAGSRFAFDLSTVARPDARVVLSQRPGLRGSEGPLRSIASGKLADLVVNERFRLRGVVCDGRDATHKVVPVDGALAIECLPGEKVQMVFSHRLREDAAAWAAKLPAEVKVLNRPYDLHSYSEPRFGPDKDGPKRAPSQALDLSVDAAQVERSLILDDALRSMADGSAVAPVTLRIRTRDYRPALRSAHERGLIADGRHPPALLHAVGVERLKTEVIGLSDRPRAEIATVSMSSLAPAAVKPPAVVAQVLDGDGWLQWWVKPNEALEFAAPAFDLFVVAGRREVLAWASDWNGGGAVAGATVELLLRDADAVPPRVVARGITAVDGTVALQLPPDLALPEPGRHSRNQAPAAWWLRATDGRGQRAARAVLPLGENDWQFELGRPYARRFWGVADKPLYRAGETVRYRIWQRELHGTRMKSGARGLSQRLGLVGPFERNVLEWDVVADDSGALQGELVLPAHLPDDSYCIGIAERGDTQGTCFFVGTYRGQDLWAQASAPDRLLRDGDRFEIDLSAGFYSGGPAVAAKVAEVSGMLTGLPLDQAYPQYRDYEFVDVRTPAAESGIPLQGDRGELGRTNGEGQLRLSLPVAFTLRDPDTDKLPAFGRLQVIAGVIPSERDGTSSNAVQARYARYPRYVGLRTEPAWALERDRTPQLEAVVIDAEGREIADASVEVEVRHADDDATVLQRCVLAVRRLTPCDFPHAKSGEYRLLARSGTAAPATLTRYVWSGWSGAEGAPKEPSLRLLRNPEAGDTTARVQLMQPYARAQVLLLTRDADRLIGHRIKMVTEPAVSFDIELGDRAREGVDVSAYVLDATPASEPLDADGYRRPPARSHAELRIELPAPAPSAPPLELRFDAVSARPGDTVTLLVRNRSGQAREVTLTVLDDALRALAGEEWALFDPQGQQWLGGVGHHGRLRDSSFQGWVRGPWRLQLPWPGTTVDGDAIALDRIEVTASRIKRADVETGTTLDRIEVTGSRIDLKDIFYGGVGRLDAPARPRDARHGLAALARVRTQFADTAAWMPGLRLAAGETRRIQLKLPDNLARWRAVAWSNGADEDFGMSEATLEVGLPLEVRLQTPTRLYPGDRARLAANARQSGERAIDVRTVLQTEGSAATRSEGKLELAPRGQTGYSSELLADAVGSMLATAAVEAGADRDAVAAPIEVASPYIAARRRQAGWLGEGIMTLALPALPASALDPTLQLSLQRGSGALVDRWTADLRDYPHRCWEQILSRAVAAALALQRDGGAQWPGAKAAVREALDNAAVFQRDDGGFRYFTDDGNDYGLDFQRDPREQPQIALTAYTAEALQLLHSLGQPVPATLRDRAAGFLRSHAAVRALDARTEEQIESLNRAALALGAQGVADADALTPFWKQWQRLSLPAQIALTRGSAQLGDERARLGVKELLARAPARGPSRVLSAGTDYERWMSSDLREQCALIDLLREYPDLANASARRELIAGLTDLYASGEERIDTQSGAVCLAALRDDAVAKASEPYAAQVALGAERSELRLAPGDAQTQWRPQAAAAGTLRIEPGRPGAAPVAYFAEVDYREDARHAQASAIGLAIERSYAVLRDGRWIPVAKTEVRVGDWLRISLVVHNGATRHFVAITDDAPGGLRPTDLSLNGVAGLDLKRVSDPGTYWFNTRRLDARSPRFYAEYLPAGRHELHYFALAGNGGDYLAAPARVELMYGKASHARTASARLHILAPAAERARP